MVGPYEAAHINRFNKFNNSTFNESTHDAATSLDSLRHGCSASSATSLLRSLLLRCVAAALRHGYIGNCASGRQRRLGLVCDVAASPLRCYAASTTTITVKSESHNYYYYD